MVKTKFERVEVGSPDIAAFRIEGKLGFHENAKIQRLVEECLKRELRTVIFDFSELSSLGGGVAKILRDFVTTLGTKKGTVRFVVTNEIITQFLQDGETSFSIHRSFAEALAAVGVSAGASAGDSIASAPGTSAPGMAAPGATTAAATTSGMAVFGATVPPTGASPENTSSVGPAASEEIVGPAAPESRSSAAAQPAGASSAHSNVIFMSYDSGDSAQRGASARDRAPEEAHGAAGNAPVDGEAEEIISEIFGGCGSASPPEWIDKPTSPFEEPPSQKKSEDVTVVLLNRQLKRRILELKTLFSISADFNAICDRKKLLDIFLLTSIAQGGVESAVFLENEGESYKPVMSKGLEPHALLKLEIASKAIAKVTGENNVIPVDSFAMEGAARETVKQEGIEYVCPFRTKDGLSGLVLLGKRIAGRGMKEEDFEFLRILVNIAQGAYDNALMFEREHERTLGIVKTLISIIEENTLLKGTSEIVSRYVGMIAKNMDYAEESFKDLIYGTVLRDMGMVKVSDLILRSPRDLTKEEWEIIKKHPEDGAEMLARMKFGEHVVNIVRTHHERFNGDGYPSGLRGKEIPLGSRIISVVESYAAMIHERPTRPALTEREALDTLKDNYGLRYDREVVMQFARIMEREIAQSVRQGIAVP
jgi:HD-GYP domain-containing protein (c-di-GMP phosphodiesterase class II)/anti-anti-sigma regulatory factor